MGERGRSPGRRHRRRRRAAASCPSNRRVDDDSTRNPVRDNPKGLKVGYNPYDSGSLGKTARIKKLDLRELSKWIDAKRKAEESGDPEK
jgi:hypothetical protein